MMNAATAHEKSLDVTTAQLKARLERTQKFIEEVCGEAIEKTCAAGKYSTTVAIPDEICSFKVKAELRGLGYSLTTAFSKGGKELVISW